MKKTFLFLLLTSFLWGGVSFAQAPEPGTTYCSTGACISTWGSNKTTNEANFQQCRKNLKDATDKYNKAKSGEDGESGNDGEIKTINKEIEKATDAYIACKRKPENAHFILMGEAVLHEQCNSEDPDVLAVIGNQPPPYNSSSYDDFITSQKAAKAQWFNSNNEFSDEIACAKVSYSQAMLNRLGDLTSSFDIGRLNVGNEANLDIVDDVTGENNILNRVLKLLTQVLGTFAVLMLIIGAFYMITSQGDESQLQKGKNIFFYTVIGLLIAFMSFIAVQFVISIIFTSTG